TVALAAFVEGHPPALVTVSEYVVVCVGLAVGVQLFGFDSPDAGDHWQLPPPDPLSVVEPPEQIVAEPEARAVGVGSTWLMAFEKFWLTPPRPSVTTSRV